MENIGNFLETYNGCKFITGEVTSVDEHIIVLSIDNSIFTFDNDKRFDYSLCTGKWYIFAFKNREIVRMMRIYNKRNGGYNERKSNKQQN